MWYLSIHTHITSNNSLLYMGFLESLTWGGSIITPSLKSTKSSNGILNVRYESRLVLSQGFFHTKVPFFFSILSRPPYLKSVIRWHLCSNTKYSIWVLFGYFLTISPHPPTIPRLTISFSQKCLPVNFIWSRNIPKSCLNFFRKSPVKPA